MIDSAGIMDTEFGPLEFSINGNASIFKSKEMDLAVWID
jgi:hypothetical protein